MPIPNVTIPSPVILAIPFVISPVVGFLQSDGLSKYVNGLLAAFFVLVTAGICLLLGGLITPDIQTDLWIYVAFAFAILNYGPCAALRQMVMDDLESPLLALVKKPQVEAVVDPVVEAWQNNLQDVQPSDKNAATQPKLQAVTLPSQQIRPIQLVPPTIDNGDHSG